MLLVPTYLATSKIPDAGLGVFAKEFIAAGTTLWIFHQGLDYVVKKLPEEPLIAKFITKYGYIPLDGEWRWVMCADDARFMNHSENPSCLDEGETTSAKRDIQAGEELTCDYRTFCREPFAGFDSGVK